MNNATKKHKITAIVAVLMFLAMAIMAVPFVPDGTMTARAGVTGTPYPGSGDWTVSTDTTYDSVDLTVKGNITVKSGTVLKFKNMTLTFSIGNGSGAENFTKILTVEDGAMLVLDNVVVTTKYDLYGSWKIYGKAYINESELYNIDGLMIYPSNATDMRQHLFIKDTVINTLGHYCFWFKYHTGHTSYIENVTATLAENNYLSNRYVVSSYDSTGFTVYNSTFSGGPIYFYFISFAAEYDFYDSDYVRFVFANTPTEDNFIIKEYSYSSVQYFDETGVSEKKDVTVKDGSHVIFSGRTEEHFWINTLIETNSTARIRRLYIFNEKPEIKSYIVTCEGNVYVWKPAIDRDLILTKNKNIRISYRMDKMVDTITKYYLRNAGTYGVYGALRWTANEEIYDTRSDATAEMMYVYYKLYEQTKRSEYLEYVQNLYDYISTNMKSGSHGGYYFSLETESSSTTEYIEDNAEIASVFLDLYKETGENKYLFVAEKLLDEIKNGVGIYGQIGSTIDDPGDSYNVTAFFTAHRAWILFKAYKITGDKSYLDEAKKSINWILSKGFIESNGRVKTYEEITGSDYIGLTPEQTWVFRALLWDYYITGNDSSYLNSVKKFLFDNLINSDGSIQNGLGDIPASKQDKTYYSDFVYANGYLLQSLVEYVEYINRSDITKLRSVEDWMFSLPSYCSNKKAEWLFFGNYNLTTKYWNHEPGYWLSNNEGGSSSVYISWTNAEILMASYKFIEMQGNGSVVADFVVTIQNKTSNEIRLKAYGTGTVIVYIPQGWTNIDVTDENGNKVDWKHGSVIFNATKDIVYTIKATTGGAAIWIVNGIQSLTWYQWLWIVIAIFIIMAGVAIYASPKINVLPSHIVHRRKH